MASALGLHRDLVRAAKAAPLLERDNERQLAVRWRGQHDEDALHELTQAHMRLVIAMATRFRHYGLSLQDLVQEGHVGLLEAAARYEPERELRFSTYASWWIRASMQDYVLRNWSIVRGGTSSGQKALFFNLRRMRAKLAGARNSDPGETSMHRDDFATIARALGVSIADVETMNTRLSGPDVSLNMSVSDDEPGSTERIAYLPDTSPLPDELVGAAIDGDRIHQQLRVALDELTDRERHILNARQLNEEPATLDVIGGELGISKERVRQIEARAIEKLRRILVPMSAMHALQ